MIVTPLWAIFMHADETVGLMLPLLLVGDIVTLVLYWRAWDSKNVGTIFSGALVGVGLGMFVMFVLRDEQLLRDGDRVFKIIIGALALFFGLAQLAKEWIVPHTETFRGRTWIGVAAGLGTGVISYLAHLGGLITTLYLLPQRLGNRVFVATSTIIILPHQPHQAAALPHAGRPHHVPLVHAGSLAGTGGGNRRHGRACS